MLDVKAVDGAVRWWVWGQSSRRLSWLCGLESFKGRGDFAVSGGCDIEQAKLGAIQDGVIKTSCVMAIRKGRPYLDEVR